MKQPAIYILASQRNGTLYTGVTSNLVERIFQHKKGITKGFSHQHNCKHLVYYQVADTMEAAISREKYIKNKSRTYKLDLIESMNPNWKDLYETLF